MSAETMDVITTPPIDGAMIEALCEAGGVDYRSVWRIYIDPHAVVFHYFLRRDGRFYKAGDEIASGTKRLDIAWNRS